MGILALYVAGGSQSFSLLTFEAMQFDPVLQTWVFLAFYIGFGILAGIWPLHHLVAGRPRVGADGGVDAARGRAHEARRRTASSGWAWDCCRRPAVDWAWLVGAIACINIVYGALSAMAQTDLKYVIAYSSVSHMGVVMLGAATLTVNGLNGSVFQMFAHGIMTGLFFALVGLVYEKAHSREIFKMGGFATMMPGIATAFTIGGLSVTRAAGDRRLRRRVPDLPGDVELELQLVAVPGRHRGLPDLDLRDARREADLLGTEERRPALPGPCPTRKDPSGRRLAFWSSCSSSLAWCRSLAIGPVDSATVPLLLRLAGQ